MNDSTAKELETLEWSRSAAPGDVPGPDAPHHGIEGFLKIASSYELEFDMYPQGKKWLLICRCMKAPSGQVYREGGAAPELGVRWSGQDSMCNPEGMAVDAVVLTALDGLLGTIRQCNVCDEWFLTKNDPRVHYCPDHDVDDLRKGTPERQKQVNAAAKRARERAKAADEEHWEQRRLRKSVRPRPHRAVKK